MGDICLWTSNIKDFYFGQLWSFEGPISSANKLFPCRFLDKIWGIHIENSDNEHLPHSLHTSLRECLLHQGVAPACRFCCKYPHFHFHFLLQNSLAMRKLCYAMHGARGTAQGRGRAQTDVTSRLRSLRPELTRAQASCHQHAAAHQSTHTPTHVIIRIAPSQSICFHHQISSVFKMG